MFGTAHIIYTKPQHMYRCKQVDWFILTTHIRDVMQIRNGHSNMKMWTMIRSCLEEIIGKKEWAIKKTSSFAL